MKGHCVDKSWAMLARDLSFEVRIQFRPVGTILRRTGSLNGNHVHTVLRAYRAGAYDR